MDSISLMMKMVTIRQWFTKWLLVICVVLCIISVFV